MSGEWRVASGETITETRHSSLATRHSPLATVLVYHPHLHPESSPEMFSMTRYKSWTLTDVRGGLGWLAGFDELLCRCGLANNGPPGDDGKSRLTLHGRIANLPAQLVEVRISLDPPFEISVSGEIEEGMLFFPHFRLTTTYT